MKLGSRTVSARLVIGLILLVGIVAFVLAAPLFGNPTATELDRALQPPLSPGHLLGTDQLGRGLATRLAWGGRSSLLIGVCVMVVSGTLGTVLGLCAGYFRGTADSIISRLIDAQLSLPLLVFLLMVLAVVGPSRPTIVIALSVAQWPEIARLSRALTMVEAQRTFVEAARVSSVSSPTILRRHILPQVRGSLVVLLLTAMSQAVLLESALSYLGVGVQRPAPTWGRILADGQPLIGLAWWLAVMPGLAIACLVLGANLVADSVRKD